MNSKEEMEMKEVLEDVNKGNPPQMQYELIPEDGTFEFQCQRCGSCCMNRDDIILNAWDVFNASKALGITCQEFLEKYTTQHLGGHSKLPVITIGHKDDGACHFLKFDYMDSGLYMCTINDHKPGACASHPLGIVTRYSMADKDEGAKNYFIKVEQCDQSKKPVKQSVKDWMRHHTDYKPEFDAAHAFVSMYTKHESFRKWYFLATVFMGMAEQHNAPKDTDPVVLAFAKSCDVMVHYTYANYDTSQPFVPQAEANLQLLDDLLSNNDNIIRKVEEAMNDILKTADNGQVMTVQQIIENNDAKDGLNMDIGRLAVLLSQRIKFENDKGGQS